MGNLVDKLYYHPLLSKIFPTLVSCLKRELKDCKSVLDIGCGPDSPIKYCQVKHSVGVDAFEPYLDESKRKKIHKKYLLGDITKIKFKSRSFDAVIMVDVLEHLEKEKGKEILKKAESWSKKKIIVTTPNGYLPQESIDKNPFQAHRSGWTIEEMKKLGYQTYGMAGWRFLRRENVSDEPGKDGGFLVTIRFRPNFFWFIISSLTQVITYHFPRLAFEVFYVKNKTDT